MLRINLEHIEIRRTSLVFRKGLGFCRLVLDGQELEFESVELANEHIEDMEKREFASFEAHIPCTASFRVSFISLEDLDEMKRDSNFLTVFAVLGSTFRSACYEIVQRSVTGIADDCILVQTGREPVQDGQIAIDQLLGICAERAEAFRLDCLKESQRVMDEIEELSAELNCRFKNRLLVALMQTNYAFKDLQPIDADVQYKETLIKSRNFNLLRIPFQDGIAEIQIGRQTCSFTQKEAKFLYVFKYWLCDGEMRHLLYSDDECEFVHAFELSKE